MTPFRDFPFIDEASKSVLRSLLLSSVSRFAFPFVPCHGFDAPAIGTGKSKLFDCASILLTGRECAVVSQPDDEVEFEKKLFAILLAGDQLVSIDNCSYALDSPFMCMVLTQPFVQSRILGLSKTASIPNSVLLGANGCNFSFAGDMLRRGLTGRLDAGVEKPWEREFQTQDPVIVFKRDRPRLVAAALTVLRGYIAAGRPRQGGAPLGGFEGWARLVRDALLWLAAADPTLTIEATRAADPARQKLEAVITQWHEVLGDRTLTTRAIIEEACGGNIDQTAGNPNRLAYCHPEFHNGLLDVAADQGRVAPERLGKWIRANLHTVVGQYRLAAGTISDGTATG
jgi:putative DNA primase/helicase